MGQLTDPELVRHLSRLRVPIVVHFGRLELCQTLERAPGEIWIDHHVLQTHDQTVATEDADEPGNPGGGQQLVRTLLISRKAQGRHIFHRLPVQPIPFLI